MLEIIRGEDKTFTWNLKNEDGSPLDLTGFTEITFCFPSETGNAQTITQTGGEVTPGGTLEAGNGTGIISDAKTLLMKVGEDQNFEAMVDYGTTRRKVRFVELLNVFETICP